MVDPRTKLAIIVGHNSRSRGADSPWLPPEFDFHIWAADLIAAAAENTGANVKVFTRKATGGYRVEIENVYGETDAWGAEASIELHYNAASPSATGTETLRCNTQGGRLLAEKVHPIMVKSFGLRDRGIKIRKRMHERGYYSLMSGRAPAILLEPGFGSNHGDAVRMKEAWPQFAKNLVAAF